MAKYQIYHGAQPCSNAYWVERELPDTPQIRIVEVYKEYTPPLNVPLLIRCLLDAAPAKAWTAWF